MIMPSFCLLVALHLSLNPLLPSVPFLYLLKTSEKLWFSDVFRGYKKGTPGSNGHHSHKSLSVSYDYRNIVNVINALRSHCIVVVTLCVDHVLKFFLFV